MKVYSVLYHSVYGRKYDDVTSGVFPRAFRTPEEAKHAIDEDARENWDELFAPDVDEGEPVEAFPGVTPSERGNDDPEEYWIEVADALTTYTIVEQELEMPEVE